MRINITDAYSIKVVSLNEFQDFAVCCKGSLRQALERRENPIAGPQVAKRKLANHKRMRKDPSLIQEVSKPSIHAAQMAHPN